MKLIPHTLNSSPTKIGVRGSACLINTPPLCWCWENFFANSLFYLYKEGQQYPLLICFAAVRTPLWWPLLEMHDKCEKISPASRSGHALLCLRILFCKHLFRNIFASWTCFKMVILLLHLIFCCLKSFLNIMSPLLSQMIILEYIIQVKEPLRVHSSKAKSQLRTIHQKF